MWSTLAALALAAATPALPAEDPAPRAEDVAQEPAAADSLTIHAERVYTTGGEVMTDAVVEVSGGKIAGVRPGRSAPRDAVRAAAVTAGMIDLSARLNTRFYSVEQAVEVQPHLDVADSLDLYDPEWRRVARTGVTTVLVNPFDRNVIGGHGAVLKTAGQDDLGARLVEGAKTVIRGAIGTEPSAGNHPAFRRPTDFYSRRPTTRMGVEWEWRKAFFDAVAAQRLPEREFPGADELRAALAGERLLMIQAWATQDIRTAVYLKEEMVREGFGELDLVIDAAAEAWREPALLARSSTAVVLPPFDDDGRVGPDDAFLPWNAARVLVDAGVTVCLSSHGSTGAESTLDRQAGLAMRGGLSFEQALAAVTTDPARILGVEDRVGTVEAGKDADLVLWNGRPFEPTSRVIGVVVGGELVLDPR